MHNLPSEAESAIKRMIGKTLNGRTVEAIGGFAALYKMDEDKFLAASTQGVGSKTKLALECGILKTVGIDLVALCVNDLICSGAKPLFFLDYYSTSKVHPHTAEDVFKGMIDGCQEAKLAFIGSETAQLPGVYHHGDFDLAGFAVGEVSKEELLDGMRISHRDTLIGIASSGFHAHGFSLLRRIIDQESNELHRRKLKMECLTPTKVYVETFQALTAVLERGLTGLAHITGSGLLSLSRINDHLDYEINFLPSPNDLPPYMVEMMERTGLNKQDLCQTFNMGIGMVVATNQPDLALQTLQQRGEKAWILGQVTQGTGRVYIR